MTHITDKLTRFFRENVHLKFFNLNLLLFSAKKQSKQIVKLNYRDARMVEALSGIRKPTHSKKV